MSYCLYLRKSRADIEAEQFGELETLARHEQYLMAFAGKLNLNITQIYREVVSGETIAARPMMQKLLSEVEQGTWEGVLVMEVERLARGNTLDQGIVSQAFQISGTKIITPTKTYDPSNEFDEEYFEFGLFMSRREYKTINRRIQRGRIASIKEGKYISPTAPYGYNRVKIKDGKGYTLEPNLEESKAVQLIYDMYVNTMIGSRKIAVELNRLGFKPRNKDKWSAYTIADILKNPVYMGYVKWGERPEVKTIENGVVVKHRKNNPEPMLIKGLHEPIISENIFHKAQEVKKKNAITSINDRSAGLRNPLAGLLVCKKCGRVMQRQDERTKDRKTTTVRIICANHECNNISSRLDYVEQSILDSLEQLLNAYNIKMSEGDNFKKNDINSDAIDRLTKEKDTVNNQISRLHDLLEQGVYDVDMYLQRSKILNDKIASIDESLKYFKGQESKNYNIKTIENFIPKIENVLALYNTLETPEAKNRLLKTVLTRITYIKTEKGKGKEKAYKLGIYPIVKI